MTSAHLTREQLRRLQLELLQITLNRAYLHVDFYRRQMDQHRLMPEDIGSVEALERFPFTTSDDLADHYPYGLFAVPLRNIVRLKVTANRQAKPIVVGFTRHDVAMWQQLVVRLYQRLGITDRDIVQVAFNFSLFPGAFTFNQAVEAVGATLAPAATISATLQLRIMQDFRSTVLATTPSFALRIVDAMGKAGVDAGATRLRMVLLGPDVLPEAARHHLEQALRVPAYGLYGVSEMVEPGLAGECPQQNGLHLAEDQFLAEIIHPFTGKTLSPGQQGELTLTTLTTEGYPLIRYRTGDITVLHDTPCPCGHGEVRISPTLRRCDARVSVRGITIYPEQVENLLKAVVPDLVDFRLLIDLRHGVGEQLTIWVVPPQIRDASGLRRGDTVERLRSHVRRSLGLGARVQLVRAEHLPREGLTYKTVFRDATSSFQP